MMDYNKRLQKILTLIITAMISVSLVMPQYYAFAAEEAEQQLYHESGQEAQLADLGGTVQLLDTDAEDVQTCTTSVSAIRRGSVQLELSGADFKNAGYQIGDLVNIEIGNGASVTLPFVDGYSGVGFQRSALSFSSRDNQLTLRMSEGSFADTYGITDEDIGLQVVISMAEQGGFLDEYNKLQIGRMSYERSDFPDLTDEEFANYRNVTTTGIKPGVLYRTSSPINPMIKRSKIADEANRKNKVTTIINLSESPESAAGREGYNESYYVTVNHFEANMSTDFGSDAFNSKIAACLRFMIEHPGIYEVNCIFGKDRTGFLIAVLEGLMGASYDELVNDYVTTYPHYYPDYNSYDPVSERDRTIAEVNLVAQIEYAYGIDDLRNVDISNATENYFRKIGMTNEEIESLRHCLSGDVSIGSVSVESVIYNGEVQGPKITYEGRVLKENTDYTWEKTDVSSPYKDAGIYTAVLTGKGSFYGSKVVQYEIIPKQIDPEVILSQKAYTYNGKVRKPEVTVLDGKTVLNASDYTVSYASGRKKVGTYKVSVELKGNYKGSRTASFKINPKGTKIRGFKKGKRSIKVKWKNQTAKMSSSRISGYQIQIATNSEFTRNKKTFKVKGSKKSSKKVKKLKSGKTYYVRVRTYKTIGKKKYCSPWSNTITVKTK